MTEEIKEILDRIKNYPEKLYCLNETEKSILLDSITNLQQEINKLTAESTEWESKYYDLQQENEDFKTIIKQYVDIVLHDRKEIERLKEDNFLIKSANKLVSNNLHNYKSRIEQAIEYVENHKFNKFGDIDCGEAEEIINILNGSDENE